MTNNRVFKMPKALITNLNNFQPSTIGVAAVFYAYMNQHRKFTNSLKNIAALTHRCEDTVSQAIDELEKAGYLRKFQNYIYSQEHQRNIYTQSTYHIIKPIKEDYTLVPYSWLAYNLTPCYFQVLLTCRMFMIQEEGRSYPSIRKIASLVKIAKSTVCLAIKEIARMGILMVAQCKKENGAYTSNSYHILRRICEKAVKLLTGRHSQQISIQSICFNSKRQRSPISLWDYSNTAHMNPQDRGVV